jgi:ribonuclease BN (tRNA processing enzyme)
VLTAPSGVPGTANIDFVLFRERWMVAEDTFRPPWYHKNIMSELMGNIYGQYDAKPQGFVPGGMSLHNMMLPHGPDRDAFEGASNADLKPHKLDNTMSFMFETRFPQHLTEFAAKEAPLQDDYIDCWTSLEKKFDGTPGGLALKALRVDHPPVVDCFALRFDTKDWSVVFSADTAFFPPLAVFAKDCDVLVHEAMLQRGVDKIVEITGNGDRLRAHLWASHTMAPDAAKIAEMAQAKTLLLNHLIPADLPGFEEQEWLEATETFSGQTIVGHDGLVIIK